MDPDATLQNILELARQISMRDTESLIATELAEAIESLDTWIVNGGFLPKSWQS